MAWARPVAVPPHALLIVGGLLVAAGPLWPLAAQATTTTTTLPPPCEAMDRAMSSSVKVCAGCSDVCLACGAPPDLPACPATVPGFDQPSSMSSTCELSCKTQTATGGYKCDVDENTSIKAAVESCGNTSDTESLELAPNIIFLISDDWGFPYYEDVGMPSGYKEVWAEYFKTTAPPDSPDSPTSPNNSSTPNLRQLAKGGAYFPVAHQCASYCAPGAACLLTGRYGKDLETPSPSEPSSPTTSRTLLDLLDPRYCTIKAGKIWDNIWDYDLAAEFDIDTGNVTNFSPYQPGETKKSLEEIACLIRQVNRRVSVNGTLKHTPFFLLYLPVLPHDPPVAPDVPFLACYENDFPPFVLQKVQVAPGTTQMNDPRLYRRNQAYYDCGVGRLLRFLQSTRDERFANKMLIETTLIVYITDNGNEITNSKGTFADNGYRSPMIFYYKGGAGSPTIPAIDPQTHPDQLASVLDAVPTALSYAGISPLYPADYGPNPKSVAATHRGQDLRAAFFEAEAPDDVRDFLFGHDGGGNNANNVRGYRNVYLRTRNYPTGTAVVGCNGATTGFSEALACKYYQHPSPTITGRCNEHLYNLTKDPDERIDLVPLEGNMSNPKAKDPCLCWYQEKKAEFQCELRVWTNADPWLTEGTTAEPDKFRDCIDETLDPQQDDLELPFAACLNLNNRLASCPCPPPPCPNPPCPCPCPPAP